jgi:hypothetical protein
MSKDVEIYDRMEDVVGLYFQGKNAVQISKALGIRFPEVNRILDTWREIASDDKAIKSRAKEVLAGADQHYSKLISSLYEVVSEVDADVQQNGADSRMLSQKTSALKAIADLEKIRFTMLKDMGMMSDAETASQQAELERKQEILTRIMREVVNSCPVCRPKVHERLSAITNDVVPVQVVHQEAE